jgi:hypothetical protein
MVYPTNICASDALLREGVLDLEREHAADNAPRLLCPSDDGRLFAPVHSTLLFERMLTCVLDPVKKSVTEPAVPTHLRPTITGPFRIPFNESTRRRTST